MTTDDGIDWQAAERVAAKYGVTLPEVEAAAYALYHADERRIGTAGQVIRAMTHRHVENAIHALAAARKYQPVEFGIMRPASMPDMSGRPRYTQIVGATFPTIEQAENARRRVPSLRGVPALICRRTAPGEWEEENRS